MNIKLDKSRRSDVLGAVMPGVVFLYVNEAYMRVHEVNGCSAVCLKDGRLHPLDMKAVVTVVPGVFYEETVAPEIGWTPTSPDHSQEP